MMVTMRHASGSVGGLVAVCVLLGGCQDTRPGVKPGDKPPTFYEDIICASIMLQSPLLDEDGDNVPDGVALKVYLNRPNQSDFVAGKGRLVLHMYKSQRTPEGKIVNQELKAWTINEEDFARAVVRQGFGLVGHQIAVYWPETMPRGSNIFLQAEFIRTDGQHIWSRSVSVPLNVNERRLRP